MKEITKTIGKKSEKVGQTTVSGEGAAVKYAPPEKVAIRDYVSGKGYSGIVNWDGENAVVAGVGIKPEYIKDGVAYVNKSDADAALEKMERGAGINNPEEERKEKYGDDEDKALQRVKKREEFSYNPNKDIVFQEYKKQYESAAVDALRRILNDNNTSIEGASGAVLSDALAAHNAYLAKVTDTIPQLFSDAYKRYTNEAEMNNADLESISNLADRYYKRRNESNNDIIERIRKSGAEERENDLARAKDRRLELDFENQDELAEIEKAKGYTDLSYYADKLAADINKKNASAENTTMKNALNRGFFIREDEASMPWLMKYRTANGSYAISPSLAKIAYEYQSAHEKERGKINAKLGR